MSSYKKPNAFQKFSMSPKRVDHLSMPSTQREPDNRMIIKMIRQKFQQNQQLKQLSRKQFNLTQNKSEESMSGSPNNRAASKQEDYQQRQRSTLKTFQQNRDPEEVKSYIEQEKDSLMRNFLLSQISPRQYEIDKYALDNNH